MLKYLIGVLILILGALAWMYFVVGKPKVYQESFRLAPSPHFYGRPDISVSKIAIKAFYFIPKNRTTRTSGQWYEALDKSLRKLVNFNSLQLQGRSEVVYKIYPVPVVGEKEGIEYDTESTQYGNPKALIAVNEELKRRVLDPAGDLYDADFSETEEQYRRVSMILYEGVGASGTDDAALVSRIFLTNPEYASVGSTIFTHEFYHTLGLPDGYIIPEAIPTTEDIMGLGKQRPVEKTYIQREFLRKLGI